MFGNIFDKNVLYNPTLTVYVFSLIVLHNCIYGIIPPEIWKWIF